MIYQKFLSFCAITLLIAMLPNWSMAQDAENGKSLFLDKCASCHNNDMKTDMTGPALFEVQDRWKKYPGALEQWIRNSVELAASGNPRAKTMIDWAGSEMMAFEDLTDEEIADMLAYIQAKGEFGCASPPCATADGPGAATVATSEPISPYIGYTLLVLLLVSVVMLGRYINSLTRLSQQNTGEVVIEKKSFIGVIFSPTNIKLAVFVLVLLGGYTTVNNAIGLGRQNGYQPTQPINFSHKIHAGDNGIDCQYCHDGARRSKHSIIPSSNTCVNCHANIQKGSKDGTKELIKIYAASGFNPSTNTYLAEDMSDEDRVEVYREWLKNSWATELEANEASTTNMINAQLESVQGTFNKPIQWVRIHNLPDHVYYNHAQHVNVGKIKCETCHGEVSEMDEIKQHSPLSMGWCVNCHRQTEVQFRDGLKEGARKGVTVEEIGGLECQKCHY